MTLAFYPNIKFIIAPIAKTLVIISITIRHLSRDMEKLNRSFESHVLLYNLVVGFLCMPGTFNSTCPPPHFVAILTHIAK
jgi:hypothetical protein